MTRDSRLENLLSDWLQDQPDSAPDQLLGTVLSDLQSAPQSARWKLALRRLPVLTSNGARYLAIAAVGVLAVVIGLGLWANRGGGVGGPATPRPTPAPLPSDGPLRAGTYLYENSLFTNVPFRFTVPDGWELLDHGWQISKGGTNGDELGLASSVVDSIYADACTGKDAGGVTAVGPTVDDLATALLDQPRSMASGPFDTTIGGHPAKRVDLTAPPAAELQGCAVEGALQIWRGPEGWFVVGQWQDSVYIVDVDGSRVVLPIQIQPNASATDKAELQAIIDSIEFEP